MHSGDTGFERKGEGGGVEEGSKREVGADFLARPLLGQNLWHKVAISIYSYDVEFATTTVSLNTLHGEMNAASVQSISGVGAGGGGGGPPRQMPDQYF